MSIAPAEGARLLLQVVFRRLGGKGSGNYGHKGRPGERGGSGEGEGRSESTSKDREAKPERAKYEQVAARPYKLERTSERAFTGKQSKSRLTKPQQGRIGEQVAAEYLASRGAREVFAANTDEPNYPVDLIAGNAVIEVKAGHAGNSPGAQQWRLTIGEPGKEEKALLAKMSPEQKERWNNNKEEQIVVRKEIAMKNVGVALGRKLQGKTVTVIIDHRRKIADVYEFDGFHPRIGWKSEEAQKGYKGSFTYRPKPAHGGAKPKRRVAESRYEGAHEDIRAAASWTMSIPSDVPASEEARAELEREIERWGQKYEEALLKAFRKQDEEQEKPRSAVSKETKVHQAADRHVVTLRKLVSHAFARSKESVDREALRAAVRSRSKTVVAAVLEDAPRVAAKLLAKPLPGVLLRVVADGGRAGMEMLPSERRSAARREDFNDTDPRAIEWAKKHAGELIDGISKTTRKKIGEIIASGLEGELERDEVIDELTDLLTEALGDDERADTIARTETMDAANEGLAESWEQAVEEGLLPPGAMKEWIAVGDSLACEDCMGVNGEQVTLDKSFSVGDDPPLHPNCRCTMGIAE